MQKSLDQGKLRQDMVNSAQFLKAHPLSSGKLGATGFCWGGGTTNFLATTMGSDLQAGAPFYGRAADTAEVGNIRAAMLVHYAEDDERAEMLEGLGLGEGAMPRFLRAAYELMGLRTYLTTGEKESRAWTFRAGSTAPQAAGVIHTDFERGFIRAETVNWKDLVDAGSWPAARDKGLVRAEGKDYIVQDGDVMEFRFNV